MRGVEETMRSIAHLLTLLLLVSLALLPGLARQEPGERQVEVLKPIDIPETEVNRTNPIKSDKSSVRAGHKLYSSQCLMCHGSGGKGDGDLSTSLGWSMPDFTLAGPMTKRTDGELYYIINTGHGHMPGQGDRLRPTQKWNMINFIRSLGCKENCTTAE